MSDLTPRRKIIGVPLSKGIVKNNDGTLLVTGLFTSDRKDEVGDIITRAATERAIPKYKQWANVRYMHQPRPVGKITRIGASDGLRWNECEIHVIDPQAAFEVEMGLLQALSVGILINVDDLTMDSDGGWVINDYQLAEISLVDHPANYDAMLQLSLTDALRDKAREEGVVPALRGVGITLQGDKHMDEELKDKAPEVAEAPVAEEAAEAKEASIEPEAPAAIAEVEKEAPVEAPEELVGKQAPAEEAPAEVIELQRDITSLAGAVDVLSKAVNTLADMLQPVVEHQKAMTATKAQPATEQMVAGPGEGEQIADMRKQLADLAAVVKELSTPVNRKGVMPIEGNPAEMPAGADVAKDVRPTDLYSAITKFVESKH